MKVPVCVSFEQLNCVIKTKVDTSGCLKPCSGLIITTFSKSERDKKWDNVMSIFKDYDKY